MKDNSSVMVYVLSANTLFGGNTVYWNGFCWNYNLTAAKIYKCFKSIIKLREVRKETAMIINGSDARIKTKKDTYFVTNIRVEAYEMLPLGEKNEEDIDECL